MNHYLAQFSSSYRQYVNGKLHNFINGLVNQLPDCDSKKELSILNFVRVFIFRDIG